jgi:transglutaminase-like putative cysteine protease
VLPLALALVAWGALPAGSEPIFGGKEKQQPAPQWAIDAAKTATPDIARDAEAVILLDEYLITVDAAGHAVEREREVRRVLKPQGRRDWGSCVAGFSEDMHINYLHAWTIAPDGRQLQAMEGDVLEYGDTSVPVMLSTNKTRVAHPPAVDPGSAVVCESEVTLPAYIQEKGWHVQYRIPVVSESLEVDLPAGRAHTDTWRNYDAVKPAEVSPNHWRWEVRNVPALDLRDIHAAPHWGALAGKMTVQWGDAAVAGTDNQWRAIGQWLDQLEAHRPDPTPEITAKAQELVSGAPDFYSKLSRIAEYVQHDYRYFIVTRGIGGLQAHSAAEIYRNRYGDCKDKSTITISMLQAVGIPAHYVFVDTARGIIDPENPSLVGNHMITAIEVPADVHDDRLMAVVQGKSGKRYLVFDPTNQHTPIGNLPYYLQGGYGGLGDGANSQVLALPVLQPEANGTEQKGTFKLAADGTISGDVVADHTGPDGGEWRQLLRETDEKERHDALEQYLGSQIPGVALNSYKFTEPKSLEKPLELEYKVTAHQYARPVGTLLLVRPRVLGEDSVSYQPKPRKVPISLDATGRWHDSYDIELPEGYALDELPNGAAVDTDFASYHSAFSVKDKTLHYERDYVVRKLELPAEKQAEFARFEAVIGSDELATAVLKKQ